MLRRLSALERGKQARGTETALAELAAQDPKAAFVELHGTIGSLKRSLSALRRRPHDFKPLFVRCQPSP
jgi:hypothetical protein